MSNVENLRLREHDFLNTDSFGRFSVLTEISTAFSNSILETNFRRNSDFVTKAKIKLNSRSIFNMSLFGANMP